MSLSRRTTLKLIAAAGLTGSLGRDGAANASAAGSRRIERVGLQLYTVRALMATDTAGTLRAVADVGYVEVETAGTGTLDPAGFARALGDVGLTAPSAHVPLPLMADQPEGVLETAERIGHDYLVLPWLPPEVRTAEGYARVIDTLNRFGEQCAAAGVQLCYHNHDFEFEPLGTDVPYTLLLRECDPALVRFELDLYWAAHAGADAAALLSADPDRFPLCHVKDRDAAGEMVDVGQGGIDFAGLFAAGTGLKHYFVEHDRPDDPLASITASFRAVRALRF